MAAPWYLRLSAALVTTLTLLLTTGCGGGDSPPRPSGSSSAPATTSPGGTSGGTPAPTTSPAETPPGTSPGPVGDGSASGGGGGSESVEGDIDSAVSVTTAYWAGHWSEFFTGSYSAPRVRGVYDGSAPDVPLCGNEPLPDDNAVYCPAGDFIAWDMDLMRWGHQRGDAWVYLVIAHEWGHAVQNRLDAGLVDLARELQADCLAGAVLFGAARDQTLTFEEGDTEELADALTALADKTPWTNTSDHGDATQRVSAFSRGAQSGVKGCLPNAGQ
ncbi:neutral zinc metallopeptidase [Streptomyces sp. NA02950]|uniref:neutral zinc metallopeptidase n=1 Tax=Streptomyces sp. NA02950 TaxID=2742137 RepID=UPI00159264D3|nr:neutral zinc metallopeptidase [Streptomyces sp. NA02950]QKV91964.1 neutral zinc metallopeptidase [Streptomyces sp. NA02950]